MVDLDQRFEEQKQEDESEQSDGEDSVVETDEGPVGEETRETEVNFCMPRGTGPDRTSCRRIDQLLG